MIAKVVHSSLNARGGSERLSVATIRALYSAGYEVVLETSERPNTDLINESYGEDLSQLVSRKRTLRFVPSRPSFEKFDLCMNTHGDIVPYFRQGMSQKNSITYCHFPLAAHLLSVRDREYSSFAKNNAMASCSTKNYSWFSNSLLTQYKKMLTETRVLTNSNFSKRAIYSSFGINSLVISPPVDVEPFRKSALSSDNRQDVILVISRFHPSKKIENAISLASLIKQNQLAKGMIIIGNISPAGLGYRDYLTALARKYKIENFVKFVYNASFTLLTYFMSRCKVYLHPLPGEPFGISTVEAMSAGMIPVVHCIGGHSEFVPKKYWFDTFRSALEAISRAFEAPTYERIAVSNAVQKFSTANFISKISKLALEMTESEYLPEVEAPGILAPFSTVDGTVAA